MSGERRRITGLEPQERAPERVDVYLDDAFAFTLQRAVVVDAGLRMGQSLDEAAIADLRRREQVQRALDRALALLSYRPRSAREIRDRLTRHGIDAEVVDRVIERLSRAGLVDDRSFARYWVANRDRFNPRGVVALRAELRRKGLAPEDVAAAVDEVDEEANAETAGRRQLRRLRGLDRQTFRQRLGGYLSRRGFPYETANRVVERLWREVEAESSGTATTHDPD